MKRYWNAACIMTLCLVLSLAVCGCKGKVEKAPVEVKTEIIEPPVPAQEEAQVTTVTEPAQVVATETIPPTAAQPPVVEKPVSPVKGTADRNKDIQKALKNAGFYRGSIDGKIGPMTKAAIREFQKAKGLKADGAVGPKTWSEMEKYLTQ